MDKRKSVRLFAPRFALEKIAQSRRCSEKAEWSSINSSDVLYLQRIARIRWRSDWLRVENLPRSGNIGHSPKWSNNLHVNVQWYRIGKERFTKILVLLPQGSSKTMPQILTMDSGHSWDPEKKASDIKDMLPIMVASGIFVYHKWLEILKK